MLSPTLQELLKKYKTVSPAEMPAEAAPKIHVDEIASKVAQFYEKTRNVIDYHEEHLLRRRFIDRVLRRRLLLTTDGAVAEAVIKEIIRSGHLPNDTVPETKINEVQRIIDNSRCLVEHLGGERAPQDLTEWLFKITISVLEETLFPPKRDEMISRLMFLTLREHLTLHGRVPEDDVDIQLFIAVQRALLKVDTLQLNWRLLTFVYPHWTAMPREECGRIARELADIKRKIDLASRHPLAPAFFRLANRYDTVFHVLGDVIDEALSFETLEATMGNEQKLEDAVRLAYQRRFRKEKKRLNRLATLSVISFLFSKIAVALAVEIPIETRLTQSFSLVNTIINILFPPFLMFVITTTIKLPSQRNVDLVVEEAKKVVFEERPKKYLLKIPKRKDVVGHTIMRIFYAVIFLLVIFYLSKFLLGIGFTVANVTIFIFFTSLVAATGVKISNRSKALSLEEKKPTFLSFILDIIGLPFVSIGKWLLAWLAKFNIVVILINVLIELPFQLLVEFLESFRGFIKSKKEEID